MNQPIFYVGNSSRQEKYRVSTSAFKKGTEIVHRKTAETHEAKKHLETICHNFEILGSYLSESAVKIVEPIDIDLKAGSISFRNVEGALLIDQIFDLLDEQKIDELDIIMEKYRSFLECFSIEYKSCNEQFPSLSNGVIASSKINCLAVVDASFSNIVVSKNEEWNLIDYEWIFDFSIPLEILLARAITSFCISYAESLRISCQRIPSIEMGSFPLPSVFLKYCGIDEFHAAWTFEKDFQSYVNGYDSDLKPLEIEMNETVLPEGEYGTFDDELIQLRISNAQMEAELELMASQLSQVNLRLKDIENSKTWKIGTKLGRFLKNILPN